MADEEKKQDSPIDKDAGIAPEYSERQQWEARTRLAMRQEYEQLHTIWKETDLENLRKEYDGIVEKGTKKLFDEYLAEQKPPTHEEIQELLSQEYETFSLNIKLGSDTKPRLFTICELSQEAEIKFYKQFKDRLLKNIPALQAIAQETMDLPFEERIKATLSAFDEGFDVLADAVVIVLNPYNDDKDITRQWVQRNISSSRQWQIVDAQIKVNRLKDFFSKIFLSGQQMQTTMSGQSFQRLQQLVR